MGIFGTGQAIRRTEDQRFLTGAGCYTGDITLEDQAYLHLLRSPFAHGDITHLDVSHARAAEGVIAVYTADDLARAGARDLPGCGIPESSTTAAAEPIQQPALARDRVRYVGEPVVAIIAESPTLAKDAEELVEFDVDELEAVVLPQSSLNDNAPEIHSAAPGNCLGIMEHGDREATDAAFENAAQLASVEIVNNRLAPTPLEPRGCNASFADGKLTLYQGCQGVHRLLELVLENVSWNTGALLVLAGPGSGKTRVLSTRIARLLHESPDEAFRVLALTFTNRASDEMRERIERMAPEAEERLFIGTFHAFSAAVT